MRRIHVSLAFLLAMLAIPDRAHAWWEFIEPFSGPGWWKGPSLDARVFCVADSSSKQEKQEAIQKSTGARLRMQELIAAGFPQRPITADFRERVNAAVREWSTALNQWDQALLELEQLAARRSASKVVDIREAYLRAFPTNRASIFSPVLGKLDALPVASPATAALDESIRLKNEGALSEYEMAVKDVTTDVERLSQALDAASNANEALVKNLFFVPGATPGFIISACRLNEGERRKAALDINMRFVWTRDERYANNELIHLTTLEPSFSWRLIDDPRYDFIDYGVGAGFYWISSEAFPSLKGAFLEPVRFDFHVPTQWSRYASAFILRFSVLNFPGGFEPDAFQPRADVRRRIASDWVQSFGIWIDTEKFKKPKASAKKPGS